jgi:hypothetical protein
MRQVSEFKIILMPNIFTTRLYRHVRVQTVKREQMEPESLETLEYSRLYNATAPISLRYGVTPLSGQEHFPLPLLSVCHNMSGSTAMRGPQDLQSLLYSVHSTE